MLKIALLKSDFVNEGLVEKHGDLPDMFSRFFSLTGQVHLDVFEVRTNELPPCKHDYDALVISGSRYSVNDATPWVVKLLEFLRVQAECATLIGFCFGHQALAKALGGEVTERVDGPNIGAHVLTMKSRPAWALPFHAAPQLLFNHLEQVTLCPSGAITIAGDASCPNQMVQYRPRILGIQAHPEYALDYQDALMAQNSRVTSSALASARERTARVELNGPVLSSWITNFIGRRAQNTRGIDR